MTTLRLSLRGQGHVVVQKLAKLHYHCCDVSVRDVHVSVEVVTYLPVIGTEKNVSEVEFLKLHLKHCTCKLSFD